jgi:hypothetical protein
MRGSWATVLAFAALGACSDGTGPDPVIVGPLTLDFCATEAPVFFAYQNDGGEWTSVDGTNDDSFTFDATERVAIAMAFDFGDEMLTDIYYATRTELLPLSDKACIETFGAKTVHGSVTGVGAADSAVVTMGGAETSVLPPPSTWTLTGVPTGPQDLVAHREVATIEGVVPDRVIIRRAQNPTNNATLSTLDFGATTSDPLTVNLASISGLTAGEDNYLDVFFTTALGTDHYLYAAPFFSTNSQAIYGVPAGLTQAGDLHRLELQAEPVSGERYRVVRRWYGDPANQSISLGPTLNMPSVGPVASSPYSRLRATLQAQSEYDSFATAYFIQEETSGELFSVFVTHTAAFHGGTPATWALEIPPGLADAGWPNTAWLIAGENTQWFVEAFDGTLADFIGATPTEEGATVRWAGRTSSVVSLRALRGEGDDPSKRVRRRPALLDQGGFRR